MNIETGVKRELLKMLGDKLTAKEYDDLLTFIIRLRPQFDDDTRIAIQDKSKDIGATTSGGQFGDWLNRVVSKNIIVKL